MSTLDINAIRDYLIQVGCKIEYPILVNAFKQYLYNPDPNVQGKVRTQFKDYVNRLATVSLENNMKFIILRPEFTPTLEQQPIQNPTVSKSSPEVKPHPNLQQKQPNIVPPQPIDQPIQFQQPNSNMILATPPPIPQHQKQVFDYSNDKQEPLPLSLPTSQPAQVPIYQQNLPSPLVVQQRRQQPQSHYQPAQITPSKHSPPQKQVQQTTTDNKSLFDTPDFGTSKTTMMPPPPPPVTKRSHLMQRPESLNLSPSSSSPMPPPRPPPRRRQSTASLFKPSPSKSIDKTHEIQDLAKRSTGRVKEHALKLNSSASSCDLNALIPTRSNTMKENRLSRDSTLGSLSSVVQRNGSHLTTRSRSSHREDESDSSSLQPIDPLRRKWVIEACNCNYNGLLTLLRDDPKLASYKDIVNGYTALHWAAKFGNLDIIKLIAGTHGVSTNIKSSAGHTPLHVAYIFNRIEAANLLVKSYKANVDIRDHSGKRPRQYCNQQLSAK